MKKRIIVAFVFLTVCNIFAQDKTSIDESGRGEEINQKSLEQKGEINNDVCATVGDINDYGIYILKDDTPPSIDYPSFNFLVAGHLILDLIPANSGGDVACYTISPDLPKGLNLNTITGVIGGTPTEIREEQIYTITATNAVGKSSFGIILSVYEFPEAENAIPVAAPVKIYPNPVSDILSIDDQNGINRLEVHNLQGKLVYADEYNDFNSASTKSVDLSKLKTGMYFVTLFKDNNEKSLYKIVKI